MALRRSVSITGMGKGRSMEFEQSSRVIRVLQGVVRISLCLVVVYLGFIAIRGFAILAGTDAVSERAAVPSNIADTTVPAVDQTLSTREGYWSFAGWAWELKQTIGADVDFHVDAETPLGRPAQVNTDEPRLLDLLTHLNASQTVEGEYTRFDLDLSPARLSLLAGGVGEQRWIDQVVVGLPDPDEANRWKLMKLRRSTLVASAENVSDLIPLPSSAKRVVVRVADDGVIQAELIQGLPGVETLRSRMAEQGYSMKPVRGFAGFDGSVLITKDDDAFLVWEPAGSGRGIALISRVDSPEPSDEMLSASLQAN